jgi:hypothetical protein
VVEQRAAGEQEAAVAPGGAARDRTRVDPDHARTGVQRRTDGGEPGAAEPDDAHVGDGVPAQRRRIVPGGGIAPHGAGAGLGHAADPKGGQTLVICAAIARNAAGPTPGWSA